MKKKIIIASISVILIVLIASWLLYHFSTDDLQNEMDMAIERAYDETELAKAENVEWFHYIESYYVIEGTDNDGEQIIVWVPEQEKGTVTVKQKKDGLTEQEVVDLLYNGLDDLSEDKRPKEIIKVKLGMVDQVPAYEITYTDQKNRHSILYIDFYKGDWYRVYNL